MHETVQNTANACEVHGRKKDTQQNINPAVVRGYASQCDALLKAGEAIRTPDIHVGNATVGYFMQANLTRKGFYGTMRGESVIKNP